MANFFWYVFLIAILALIVGGGIWVARMYMSGASPRSVLFGPRPVPRLSVVDHANVDGRRRLVLIRRDNIEHLIMTGGPVDVVIETGIAVADRPTTRDESDIVPLQPDLPAQPVFTRSPRVASGAADNAAE